MIKYSPYDNIKAQNYPNFDRNFAHDSQVMYWEAAKYAAKLRATKPTATFCCSKPTLAPGTGLVRRYDG